MRHRVIACVGVVLLLSAGAAVAQKKSKGKKKRKDGAAVSLSAEIEIAFGAEDIRIIRDWFEEEQNLAGLPPGLSKRDELPPGLQKQLVKNGTLPPGLEKKLHPLPPVLESKLPRPPAGSRRVILSGSVILLGETNRRIFDVIEDVIR